MIPGVKPPTEGEKPRPGQLLGLYCYPHAPCGIQLTTRR